MRFSYVSRRRFRDVVADVFSYGPSAAETVKAFYITRIKPIISGEIRCKNGTHAASGAEIRSEMRLPVL